MIPKGVMWNTGIVKKKKTAVKFLTKYSVEPISQQSQICSHFFLVQRENVSWQVSLSLKTDCESIQQRLCMPIVCVILHTKF